MEKDEVMVNGNAWRRGGKHNRGDEFLVVFVERERLFLIEAFLFRERLANRAGKLPAESHFQGLLQGNDLGELANHVGPGETLDRGPLTAAGKDEGEENDQVGQPSHEIGMAESPPRDKGSL